ncbi:hypothetical protein [Demequina subtropica]|uniref:hypothetical protein n=1 Tax=Demequina subtropica TaxID=1638989 RepID=UPI0007845A7E|nr:hypothetical protein [Demequina subtropica]
MGTPGSDQLVAGLWKWLLWGPIVGAVGYGIFYLAALYAESPGGWFVLARLMVLTGGIVGIVGIVQTVLGVRDFTSVVESAARRTR